MVCQRGALLMFTLLVKVGRVGGCPCPAATVLSQFPSEVPADACCLNYSGSAFGHVRWSAFANGTDVDTLDLSFCNITSVHVSAADASTLRRVFLGRNRLTALPRGFLAGQPSLTEVDLSENLIQELPEGFLQGSDSLQKLDLQGNQLRFLPGSLLQKPSLQTLELDGNPWDCSCVLLKGLEEGRKFNGTAKLQNLLGNLTCVSPWHLAGRTAFSVRLGDVCRPAGLTALFIVLPLVILSALVLCWCCGRKKKEAPVSASKKKRASDAACNGQKHRGGKQKAAAEPNRAANRGNEGILKNQLQLRPPSALLGSTRDIYEEVEIKLGSVECLPRASGSTEGEQGPQGPDVAGKADLDSVSVTEVMKDSADREKAYLTQSTEYYSLVPGIELEDSDHGEYENVSLS
ncbi:leucine-rich repeat-containing protein 38 [Cyclopterus lumpus]|uniref:LRRCT domain-containing protein n=1 Tax=Cyclopterus lumpus TaxID=8103 RepID=A0A8C2ZGQ3_CYCLU|nr:leucine-rich repeat-containing protein 38 [Cyclopterus lumpus]XP_034410745.1 leucine-rich repeat-containing protein 38 [Cyclopterus lumpus]XP_034410746.1 leucine-rich repeat-containing protein 38 [Cyclopterus lumpus]XP_034410747.1 leucine-rich repeat-containing protein 38 [Cyclopterus lumpus]